MAVESGGPVLSTVFVDYDNIYLSLKRKNEEAAKRFAKDSALWLREIASGRLITPTNGSNFVVPRRNVMNRCYGNPVPRRNSNDNSTDMNSFPFVRHHFLRAGFEVIDCPPLTAQLKNSADIRMVMDVRDVLLHETRFDEFILLSGDADFTPVLHRLRAHARRTVVFANDHTAQPYTALSDGEIRESSLISLLLEGRIGSDADVKAGGDLRPTTSAELEVVRKSIVAEVVRTVRAEQQPVPLEALADRAVRLLGHEKTVGSAWGGAGGFRELLVKSLPQDIKLSEQPPYVAFETTRQIARDIEQRQDAPIARERRADFSEPPRMEAPRMEASRAEPRLDFSPSSSRPIEPRMDYDRGILPEQRLDRGAPAARDPRLGDAGDDRYDQARYALPRETRHELTDAPHEPLPRADARGDYPAQRSDRAPAPRGEPQAAPSGFGQSGFFAPPPEQRVPLGMSSPRASLADAGPQTSSGGYGARPSQAPTPPSGQSLGIGADPLGSLRPAAASAPAARPADQASQIQQSIARIHEACQAPPLSPPEYRVLFEVMAEEITTNNLSGHQTLLNIVQRARDMGLEVRRDDVRFVLEVVSETDPWFDQGASANLFASRFRNFVVARCRAQGLALSADEIDLIDAWFGGAPPSQRTATQSYAPAQTAARPQAPAQGYAASQPAPGGDRWQGQDVRGAADARGALSGGQPGSAAAFGSDPDDEFPRIVRSRLRG